MLFPHSLQVAQSSSHATLSPRIAVFGHSSVADPCPAHTIFPPAPRLAPQPHRRFSSSPARRQSSHRHPAVCPAK